MANKLLRGISDDILLKLGEFSPRGSVPLESNKSGRQRPDTNKIIVHVSSIRALGSPFWYQVAEIEELALRIAAWKRHSNQMQSPTTVYEKLIKEKRELSQIQRSAANDIEILYRAANVVYYIACVFLSSYEVAFFHEELRFLSSELNDTDPELLMLICLAKFRIRAALPEANKEQEKLEIARCLTNFSSLLKLPVKTLD